MKKLAEIRKKIDAIDRRIVALLNSRARAAVAIGKLKRSTREGVYVPTREREVLAHIRAANTGPLSDAALLSIYREIMSAALALERKVRVAYLGPELTFTHQAARARFGAGIEYLPQETIADVFAAVEKGAADYGVVPIENSTEGAVTHTLDEFVDTTLKICAEIYLAVSHHLASAGAKNKITRVYSHPNVFGQCRRWLQAELPSAELIPVTSTARAAELAATEKGGSAALAGELAIEAYGLKRIASDVQDSRWNETRFLVVGKTANKPTGEDKTSLMFSVKHRAGALCSALEALRERGVNMTKIESRPSRLKTWEYLFFVDIEGHAKEKRVAAALGKMAEHCTLFTVLGSYPRAPEKSVERRG